MNQCICFLMLSVAQCQAIFNFNFEIKQKKCSAHRRCENIKRKHPDCHIGVLASCNLRVTSRVSRASTGRRKVLGLTAAFAAAGVALELQRQSLCIRLASLQPDDKISSSSVS